MNVSIYITSFRRCILYLSLFCLPVLVNAQFYDNIQILENDTLNYTVNSFGVGPSIAVPPNHGTATWENSPGPGTNVLVYVPNTNYTGKDTLKVVYKEPLRYVERVLEIEVLAAIVKANNDYESTNANTPLTIDVKVNDIGQGGGVLALSNISLVNNGSAVIDSNDQIVFTPEASFVGEAHLNYTVCLGNACDVGVLTVFVEDTGVSVDTIQLSTNRAVTKEVILPLGNGYTILESPNNGTLSVINNGVIEYTPFNGFYDATDKFTIQYNTNTNISTAAYLITVLNTELPNTFAKDDFVNVIIDGEVMADVTSNDNQLLSPVISSVLVELPQNGTATVMNNQIKYVPNAGYFGADKLVYKSCVNNGTACENAEVNILVDNLNPTFTSFYLSTPVNTPMVINYGVPFTDFIFDNIDEESDLGGIVDYFDGAYNGEIHGQNVDGYNVIAYDPPTGYTGEDRFEFEYCVNNDCELVKIIVDVIPAPLASIDTFCVSECVWPGDANRDGIVDIGDLLPVGYCVGEIGPSRPNGANDWFGQYSSNWGRTISSSRVDLKNVDTDGDGLIQAADTAAISQQYGLTHTLTASSSIVSSTLPLFFVPQNPGPYNPGDLVLIDVILGNPAQPAIDISGLTFALNYNSDIVEQGTFEVNFKKNSWLTYNTPELHMVQFPYEGRAEAGISRTSGNAASGDGIVATVSFIIDDLIDGIRGGDTMSLNLKPSMPSIMNGNGQIENLPLFDLVIDVVEDSEGPTVTDKQLLTYPNPSQEILNVHINGDHVIETVEMFTLSGQQIYFQNGINNNHSEINVLSFRNGLYVLRATTTDGVISRKIEIFKN